MLPMAAAGLAQGVFGIGQALFGASKLKAAKKAAEEAMGKIETKEVDPLIAQRVNAPMPGEETARQDIGQTLTQSLRAARSKKGGLQSITGAAAQANKAKQALATQKGQFKIGAENALASERDKALKSRQEKQQLQANISLQDVAAQRSNITQGLSGLASGIGNFGFGVGKLSDITNPIGKGFKFLGGMFGKKRSDPYSGVEI
jgi:uncharacterized phage infection (PIP) family protein YhgE